jgi:hypothetical protein
VRAVERNDDQLLGLVGSTRDGGGQQGNGKGGLEKGTKHGHRDNLFAAFLLQNCGEAAVALAFFAGHR